MRKIKKVRFSLFITLYLRITSRVPTGRVYFYLSLVYGLLLHHLHTIIRTHVREVKRSLQLFCYISLSNCWKIRIVLFGNKRNQKNVNYSPTFLYRLPSLDNGSRPKNIFIPEYRLSFFYFGDSIFWPWRSLPCCIHCSESLGRLGP